MGRRPPPARCGQPPERAERGPPQVGTARPPPTRHEPGRPRRATTAGSAGGSGVRRSLAIRPSPPARWHGQGLAAHGRRPHQRAVGPQPAGHDPGRPWRSPAATGGRSPPGRPRRTASPKPRATEPATTASSRSSRLATEATARPTSVPVRRRTRLGRLGGGPPGHRLDGRPGRLGLEAAPAPAGAGPAVGLDHHVADVAGVARRPVEQPAVEHDPARPPRSTPPWPGSWPSPGPHPASPRPGPAPWRRCRRRPAARPGRPAAPAGGTGRQPGILRGLTVSPPAAIGPPQPTPHTTGSAVVADRTSSDQRRQGPEHHLGIGGGRGRRSGPRPGCAPSASTTAAAILVPPISTASTTGPVQVAGTAIPGPTRPSGLGTVVNGDRSDVPAGRTGHSSRWKRPRIQSRGSCTVLLRLRLCSDREMSSIPALPIRRALLANTTPGQEHHHHADEARGPPSVEKVRNMKTRAATKTRADQMQ